MECGRPGFGEPRATEPLPAIRKKSLYRDQFAVSNFALPVDSDADPQRVARAQRWRPALVEVQALVCPSSGFHTDEALPQLDNDSFMRSFDRVQTRLSGGFSFSEALTIELSQLRHAAEGSAEAISMDDCRLIASSPFRDDPHVWMPRHRPVVPADLALLLQVLLRLQGLGRGVQTEVRVTELVEPYIHQIMSMRFDPRRVARRFGIAVRSWDHFISGLPGDLRSILEQIRTGSVGIDFRIHDADHAVDRLVDGLVIAASMMAGAQLISRRTAPLVGAFSIPGLLAAGAGVITWQRLITRRKPRDTFVTRSRKALDVARS